MPQLHVWKHRFPIGCIHILIAQVGSVRTELPRDLGVEAWCIEGVFGPMDSMTIKKGFVEPLVLWTDENRVGGQDRLANLGLVVRSQEIAIERETRL